MSKQFKRRDRKREPDERDVTREPLFSNHQAAAIRSTAKFYAKPGCQDLLAHALSEIVLPGSDDFDSELIQLRAANPSWFRSI